ncbi:Uncharacterised protein [Kingella potus]|uniref:Uncharacterized protein n=1 Tax=Kingella potus TaxID=265175 RepID=A0A377R4D9_9NEIS|nr:hypothetical protein [Kingella potus]UOP00507.1 hypothetical protein LVJ84_11770 [Kingella potus]STR02415.1 Uncharacterised protein [Kingella potus]
MKLNARFNTFTLPRYREAIANHQRYTDFNPLALYRSIVENDRLGDAEKLEVLALANQAFPRFYRHLLLKDLHTYAALSRLGLEPLCDVQMRQYTAGLRREQDKEFAKRKIRNRRIGVYTVCEWADGGEERKWMNRHKSVKACCAADKPPAHRQNRKGQVRDIRRLLDEENG